MICSFCVRPKVNYISNGNVFCGCGGVIDMDTSDAVQAMLGQDRDPRPAIFPPPSPPAPRSIAEMSKDEKEIREAIEAARVRRRRWLTRFTRTLGNEMFDCAVCQYIRSAAQMMRFADNEAPTQTVKTDWCGICVKDAVKEICPTKGDFKRVWTMLKDGIILPENLLNSSVYEKPSPVVLSNRQVTTFRRRESVWHDPVKPRKPEGPPPELDLAL